jgi:hypothetical protein
MPIPITLSSICHRSLRPSEYLARSMYYHTRNFSATHKILHHHRHDRTPLVPLGRLWCAKYLVPKYLSGGPSTTP